MINRHLIFDTNVYRIKVCIALHGKPMTRQEMSRITGLPINIVSGRVHDMLDKTLVKIGTKKRDRISGEYCELIWFKSDDVYQNLRRRHGS